MENRTLDELRIEESIYDYQKRKDSLMKRLNKDFTFECPMLLEEIYKCSYMVDFLKGIKSKAQEKDSYNLFIHFLNEKILDARFMNNSSAVFNLTEVWKDRIHKQLLDEKSIYSSKNKLSNIK